MNNFDIAPHDPSSFEIVARTIIWIIVWVTIAIMVFIILLLLWSMFELALKNSSIPNSTTVNPLLWLILMIIAFCWSFIWALIVTWFYNLFFSNKYYDVWKMFRIVLTVCIIIFLFFAPLYILFYNLIEILFVILWFHIMFNTFIFSCCIEFTTNPNYSLVHIVWTTIGFAISLLFFWIVYKTLDLTNWNSQTITILLSLPAILSYSLIPLSHSIWEKIYFGFYNSWNNFFYIPSLTEVMIDEEEDENSINVE